MYQRLCLDSHIQNVFGCDGLAVGIPAAKTLNFVVFFRRHRFHSFVNTFKQHIVESIHETHVVMDPCRVVLRVEQRERP